MPKSHNNKITKRGNHRQRVRTHDEYLSTKFPDQFNLTNPYSAVVAEMLDEEMEQEKLNQEAQNETDLQRFDSVEEHMADLNLPDQELVHEGEIVE